MPEVKPEVRPEVTKFDEIPQCATGLELIKLYKVWSFQGAVFKLGFSDHLVYTGWIYFSAKKIGFVCIIITVAVCFLVRSQYRGCIC